MRYKRIPIIVLVVLCGFAIVSVTIASAGKAQEEMATQTAVRAPIPETEHYLFSISPRDEYIRLLDPNDASTILSYTLFISGGPVISGVTGLATNPRTNEMYGLLRMSGPVSRVLALINPFSGEVNPVGDTGDNFAALAFNSSGTLYGFTGNGATVSETLFTIDTDTASTTFVESFVRPESGSDGDSLAYNPEDGLLYRGSGHDGSDVTFMSINPTTLMTTEIPITGTLQDEEAMALTWWAETDQFLWAQNHTSPTRLFNVASNGSHTLVGDLDHVSKGLAFITVAGRPEAGLYGSSADGELFLIDINTGAGTLIGHLTDNGSTEIEYNNLTGKAFNQLPNGAQYGYEFDIRTGLKVTGPISNGGAYTGMEFVGDILYATVITGPGGPSLLQTLEFSTGLSTTIGATGIGPISGLAYDEENDIMYGVSGRPPLPSLYTIDLATGTAVTVGTTITWAGSLQFGPDGMLYAGVGPAASSGNLYRIDPATGAYTLVGPTGFNSTTGLTLVLFEGEIYLPIVLKN